MNATGYQDDPREPIRRSRRTFYPPSGTYPRRGDRAFRCPPQRGRGDTREPGRDRLQRAEGFRS